MLRELKDKNKVWKILVWKLFVFLIIDIILWEMEVSDF